MAPTPRPNHYQILGVDSTASQDEIKQAHRRIALRCHPDRTYRLPQAERLQLQELLKEANQANEILGDSYSRTAHDRELREKRTLKRPAARPAKPAPNIYQSQTYTADRQQQSQCQQRQEQHDDHRISNPFARPPPDPIHPGNFGIRNGVQLFRTPDRESGWGAETTWANRNLPLYRYWQGPYDNMNAYTSTAGQWNCTVLLGDQYRLTGGIRTELSEGQFSTFRMYLTMQRICHSHGNEANHIGIRLNDSSGESNHCETYCKEYANGTVDLIILVKTTTENCGGGLFAPRGWYLSIPVDLVTSVRRAGVRATYQKFFGPGQWVTEQEFNAVMEFRGGDRDLDGGYGVSVGSERFSRVRVDCDNRMWTRVAAGACRLDVY